MRASETTHEGTGRQGGRGGQVRGNGERVGLAHATVLKIKCIDYKPVLPPPLQQGCGILVCKIRWRGGKIKLQALRVLAEHRKTAPWLPLERSQTPTKKHHNKLHTITRVIKSGSQEQAKVFQLTSGSSMYILWSSRRSLELGTPARNLSTWVERQHDEPRVTHQNQ